MTIFALLLACFALTTRRSLLSGTLGSFVSSNSKMAAERLRILVNGGDNMLGRAVQLSFPVQAPGEELIKDSCTAAHYVDLSIGHPSGHKNDPKLDKIRSMNADKGSYLWGDYRENMKITPPPDIKMLNIETAVTTSIHNSDLPLWKGIRYHMHEDNFENIMSGFCEETHGASDTPPAPVVVNFANNHGMDYGRTAMENEMIPLLKRLTTDTFQPIGLGMNLEEASKPAVVQTKSAPVQVFGFSSGCSGTPREWWATSEESGLLGLPGLHSKRDVDAAMKIAKRAMQDKPNEGIRIVSIHWGPNWAMKGEGESDLAARRLFAHRLLDELDVDMIYGHSSHHVRGLEVYKNKLIMYGTGDIINDYEGFENPGEEKYSRLGGVYLVDLDAKSGDFEELVVIPTFMNRLRLERFTPSSTIWRPWQRKLENNPNKSKEFCDFMNELSILDAGGKENALLLEHCEFDEQVPGGPVLRSTSRAEA